METSKQASNQAPIDHSFAGAMMSCMLTDAIFRGIQGTPNGYKFDLVDTSLSAVQSGISYIAYQAAVESLAKVSKKFKEIKEDPSRKSQFIVYVVGGSLAASFATGINYPIECIRDLRHHKKEGKIDYKLNMSFKNARKWYADRVFGYIGFATSMGNIIPHLKQPKSSIHKWYQSQLLIQMSHLNGILTAYPYQYMRYGVAFVPYMKNYMKSVGRKIISSDLSNYFKREISGIPFMQI